MIKHSCSSFNSNYTVVENSEVKYLYLSALTGTATTYTILFDNFILQVPFSKPVAAFASFYSWHLFFCINLFYIIKRCLFSISLSLSLTNYILFIHFKAEMILRWKSVYIKCCIKIHSWKFSLSNPESLKTKISKWYI